jgi:hypothetical protein
MKKSVLQSCGVQNKQFKKTAYTFEKELAHLRKENYTWQDAFAVAKSVPAAMRPHEVDEKLDEVLEILGFQNQMIGNSFTNLHNLDLYLPQSESDLKTKITKAQNLMQYTQTGISQFIENMKNLDRYMTEYMQHIEEEDMLNEQSDAAVSMAIVSGFLGLL